MNDFKCEPPFEPIEIIDASFTVNGLPGIIDSERQLGEDDNCPAVDSTVVVNPIISGGDNPSVNYIFSVAGVIIQQGASNQLLIPRQMSVFEDYLICEMVATDVGGAVSNIFEFNIGWIHGIKPTVSDTLQSFVSSELEDGVVGFSSKVVSPGDTLIISYTEGSNFDLGYPPATVIESVVNNSSPISGNPYNYIVQAGEPDCKIRVNAITVDNSDDDLGIPRTSSVFQFYGTDLDSEIAVVQNPIDGTPCGNALGACCIGGVFDPVTGITTGSCSIQTESDCISIGGVYKGNETICESFPGSPCEEEVGVGRCCCVQFDNSGLCVENVLYSDCNTTNPIFENCGGSQEYPDPVWTHNGICNSDVPCVGPQTGRCCEYIENNTEGLEGLIDGFTCGIGLEEGDCPRYDTSIFSFSFDGDCPDCRDPNEHNSDCCPVLGRCCADGVCVGNQLRIDCPSNFDPTSNVCPNCQTNPTGLPCCPSLGRCCWKENNEGNCVENTEKSFCDKQPGIYDQDKQWTLGNVPCPGSGDGNCLLNEQESENSESNFCCDTVLGRCCTRETFTANCEQDVLYSECNDPATQIWDFTNSSCPPGTPGACEGLSLQERNLNKCCNRPFGRCCWRNGEDGNCVDSQTLEQCSLLVGESIDTIINNGNFQEGENCPSPPVPGAFPCSPEDSETNICCDVVRRPCCKDGECLGLYSYTQCSNAGGELVDVFGLCGFSSCPSCEDDCPNSCIFDSTICEKCCTPPELSFDGYLVDGIPYDPNTNPIDRGSVISLQVSSNGVSNIQYTFKIIDGVAFGDAILQQGESNEYTLENIRPLGADYVRSIDGTPGRINSLPGEIISYEISGDGVDTITGDLPNVVGEAPVLPDDGDFPAGRRIGEILTELKYFDFNDFDNPVVDLNSGGEDVNINATGNSNQLDLNRSDFDNDIVQMDPIVSPTVQYLDGDDNPYQETGDIFVLDPETPGCVLKVKLKFENDYGSAEKTYVVGTIISDELGDLCGTATRACCRVSTNSAGNELSFLQTRLSNGNEIYFKRGNCSVKTKLECEEEGGNWQSTLTVCPCDDAPSPWDAYTMGSVPCCRELKGRCCKTSGCSIGTKEECVGGTWTILGAPGNPSDDGEIRSCDDYCTDNPGIPSCGCPPNGSCCCRTASFPFEYACYDSQEGSCTEERCRELLDVGVFPGADAYWRDCPCANRNCGLDDGLECQ